MASGKKPASKRSEYFVIGQERYSRVTMDLFETPPDEPISLALVKQVWENKKQWGRGLAAAISAKRKTLDHALHVLCWDEDAKEFMEQELGKVKHAAAKNYWEGYIVGSIGCPGTLADAQRVWEGEKIWHADVLSLKRHTIEHALKSFQWTHEAGLFLEAGLEGEGVACQIRLDPPAKTPLTDQSSPKKSRGKTRRPICQRCRTHIGLENCRHKPGGKFCVWFQEVERKFPGRFAWDDEEKVWTEAQEEWTEARGQEITDEQVEAALELLRLPEDYDQSLLGSTYRRLALASHPDKSGLSSTSFRKLHDAFEILKGLLRKKTHPTGERQVRELLALPAPTPSRRRWRLGAFQSFLQKRSAMEQREYDILRQLLSAGPSKAKAVMDADASALPLRKRRRIESDDEC